MRSSGHLIERAAERLARSGKVPGYPSPDGAPPSGTAPASDNEPAAVPQPVIGMTQLLAAGLIADSGARSRIAEELWLVQRQILRTAFAGKKTELLPANLLMVSSARPGEGKTFTALNLAASIARQGDHRVLLIDADIKQHSLSHQLGQQDVQGLLDLIADATLDLSQLPITTAISNLSFLPIGCIRQRSSDLLSGKQAARLLQGLAQRERDRLVIVDMSPCLATSDAAAIAPVVGQILFIVEAERTQRREVESALDLLQECPTITLLLNKMQQSVGTRGFGAYSPYYSV